jgi:hypothetical protein
MAAFGYRTEDITPERAIGDALRVVFLEPLFCGVNG